MTNDMLHLLGFPAVRVPCDALGQSVEEAKEAVVHRRLRSPQQLSETVVMLERQVRCQHTPYTLQAMIGWSVHILRDPHT